jgi:hypothetical protein
VLVVAWRFERTHGKLAAAMFSGSAVEATGEWTRVLGAWHHGLAEVAAGVRRAVP